MSYHLLDLEKLRGKANTPDSLGGIVLGNFRCFAQRSYVPLAPVTLIFGENSSGKTTLLHAINFISRSLEAFSVDVDLPIEPTHTEPLPQSVKSFFGWSAPSLKASFSQLPDRTQERHVDKLDLDYISKVFATDSKDPHPLLSYFTDNSTLTLGADYGNHAVVIDWQAVHLPERAKFRSNTFHKMIRPTQDDNPLNQTVGPFWPCRLEEYFHFKQPIELSNPLVWMPGTLDDLEHLKERTAKYEAEAASVREYAGDWGEDGLHIAMEHLDNPDVGMHNSEVFFDCSSMVFLRLDACIDWLKRLEMLYKWGDQRLDPNFDLEKDYAEHAERIEKMYAELAELDDDCFALLDKSEENEVVDYFNLLHLSNLGMHSESLHSFFDLDSYDTDDEYHSLIHSFWAEDPRKNQKGFLHHAPPKSSVYISTPGSYTKKDIQAFGFVFQYLDHVELYDSEVERLTEETMGVLWEQMDPGEFEYSNNWQQSGRPVDMLRDFISVCVSKVILDNREYFPILIGCEGHPYLQGKFVGDYKREPVASNYPNKPWHKPWRTLLDAVTFDSHQNLIDWEIATGDDESVKQAESNPKDTCSGPPYEYQFPWDDDNCSWISEFSSYYYSKEKLRVGSFLFQDDFFMGDEDISPANPFHVPFLRLILAASEITVLVAAYQSYFSDELSEHELSKRGQFHKLFTEDLCNWHENAKFCFLDISTGPPIECRPEFQFLWSQEEVVMEYTRGLAQEIESILTLLGLNVNDLIPLLDIQCAYNPTGDLSSKFKEEIRDKLREDRNRKKHGEAVGTFGPKSRIQITSIFRPSAIDRLVESVISSPLPSDQDRKHFVEDVFVYTKRNFTAFKLKTQTSSPNTIEPNFSFVMKNPDIGVELLRAAAKGGELGQMTSLIFAWICAGKEERRDPWWKCGNGPIDKCDPIMLRPKFGNYRSSPTQELFAERGGPQDYFFSGGDDNPQKEVVRKLSSIENCKKANEWFKRLGIDYKVKYDTVYLSNRKIESLSFFDLRSDPDCEHSISYSDLGFGISQILPVILNCTCQKHSIMTVDEPEASVHPRLQAELGSLFLDARSAGNQIIAATHSEYLVLRMLRHVRTGKLDANDLCVLYVSRDEGGSTVKRLRVDDRGEFIDTWPGGFFDDRLDELLGDEID